MKTFLQILKCTIAFLMVFLVIVVFVGVFYRYVLQKALFWSTEVSIFLQIWVVFIGASIAFCEKSHISIDVFTKALRYKHRIVLEFICNLIIMSFFILLFIKGISIVRINMTSLSEALKIPYGLVYICVPFSSFIMLIQTLLNLYNLFIGRSNIINDYNTSH